MVNPTFNVFFFQKIFLRLKAQLLSHHYYYYFFYGKNFLNFSIYLDFFSYFIKYTNTFYIILLY